jgi:hypothetical protein
VLRLACCVLVPPRRVRQWEEEVPGHVRGPEMLLEQGRPHVLVVELVPELLDDVAPRDRGPEVPDRLRDWQRQRLLPRPLALPASVQHLMTTNPC